MSTHNKAFNGGIQKNTTAFDDESFRLDKYLKDASKELSNIFTDYTHISLMKENMKIDLVGDACFGFAPDGGAWFKDGILVAAFEAKKQGQTGNACERWWDNAVTAKHINEDVIYVTFCSGAGAEQGQVLDKLRRKARIMMGDNYIFHMSVDGFSYQDIKNKMTEILDKI